MSSTQTKREVVEVSTCFKKESDQRHKEYNYAKVRNVIVWHTIGVQLVVTYKEISEACKYCCC